MGRAITYLSGWSILLASCSSAPLRIPQAKAPPAPASNREAAVITVTPGNLVTGAGLRDAQCKAETESESGGFAFLAPLIGVAVDAAIGVVSDQLAKAKAGRTAAWPATLGGVPLKPGHYCLSLSRGVITGAATPAIDKLELGDKAAFDGTPAFVMLANLFVEQSKTGYNLQVTPQYLSYAETSAPKRGSGKKEVSVLLSFDGAAPAAQPVPSAEAGGGSSASTTTAPSAGGDKGDDAKKNAGSMQLPLGRLTVGKSYNAALLSTVKAQTSVNLTDTYTVSAVVTESEDPSVALTSFAAAFEKDKDSLSTALQTDIKKALGAKATK